MTQPESLDYLLPLLSSGSYSSIIQAEVSALRTIVKDILQDIQGRKGLEGRLLSDLEGHVMRIHSGLMNLRSTYANTSLDAVIGLEHELGAITQQKIRSQESTARDLIELKKQLWHYFLLLKQKEAQLNLFK